MFLLAYPTNCRISEESLKGDYSKIQPGDCIVAFSRADIFSIRRQIERLTPYKCSVIYGALPPETRSTQARLFNEDNTGYDVLVASDAIGMGLNLNIKRVIFHTTIKRERGTKTYWVDPSSVKQIGGRAGRLSSAYKEGEVTCWQEADLAYVRGVMSWEIPPILAAGIFPSVEQVEVFRQQMQKAAAASSEGGGGAEGAAAGVAAGDADDDWQEGEGAASVSGTSLVIAATPNATTITTASSTTPTSSTTTTTTSAKTTAATSKTTSNPRGPAVHGDNSRLAHLLERFVELARMDGRYFLCDHQDMIVISNWLHSIPLTLAERFTFANAPVSLRDSLSTGILYQFAAAYALRRPVALNIRISRQKPRDILEFADLCLKHNILDLYLWLSLRYPDYFIEQDLCQDRKAHAVAMIEDTLDLSSLQQKFSHSRDYQIVRQNMLADTDALPPLEFGDVRQSTRENIAKIGREELYVFPHIREEEALAGRAGGASTGRNSYQGDNRGRRSSPNPPRPRRVDKRAIV